MDLIVDSQFWMTVQILAAVLIWGAVLGGVTSGRPGGVHLSIFLLGLGLGFVGETQGEASTKNVQTTIVQGDDLIDSSEIGSEEVRLIVRLKDGRLKIRDMKISEGQELTIRRSNSIDQ